MHGVKGTEGGDNKGWRGIENNYTAEFHSTAPSIFKGVWEKRNRKDLRCFTSLIHSFFSFQHFDNFLLLLQITLYFQEGKKGEKFRVFWLGFFFPRN